MHPTIWYIFDISNRTGCKVFERSLCEVLNQFWTKCNTRRDEEVAVLTNTSLQHRLIGNNVYLSMTIGNLGWKQYNLRLGLANFQSGTDHKFSPTNERLHLVSGFLHSEYTSTRHSFSMLCIQSPMPLVSTLERNPVI